MNRDRGGLLSEQAYRMIKRMIISLELEPGSIVRESMLAQDLGFGRTPVREALLRLSLEQLVTIIPRQGILIPEIAANDLQHLVEVRLSVETLAARLAARRGRRSHWQEMENALRGVESSIEGMDNEDLIQVDDQCHEILYRATGNKFLERTASILYASSLRLWYYFLPDLGDMREAIGEHVRILDALEAGDADRAAELIERHIRAFHQQIQAAIATSPPALAGS